MIPFRKSSKPTNQENGMADRGTSSLASPSTERVTLLGGFVAGSVWDNPVVGNAVSVLGQLSDIGKTLPYVAPAFIILKLIIDVELKARDADVKCNDLLERITFMLSHLPALKSIHVMEPTRQVIERMNEALKNAAALIQAYRKQSKVARRLNVGNKEKFIICSAMVDACCKDLMTSLQIHQAGQLDILARSVPIDPEDEAAQIFIANHGGVAAIKSEKELVTQFAEELHLKVDDDVMDQLNSNFAQVMEAQHAQLERTLNENVSAAVIDGIRGLAAQMNEAEKEQVFTCVQCDKEYRNSVNGPTSCSFHRAEYSSWNSSYPCCGTSIPCQYGSHRSVHHCEYPYGSFFERSRNITNYVDTVDEWVSVEDTDLKNDNVSKASVGQLLRWVSKGALLEEPTILITVGTVWFSTPYFFDTFTAKQLRSVSKFVSATGRTVIFRTSSSEDEFAMAEWCLSSAGVIDGVRLVAKTATSDLPYIRVCPIDVESCTKSGDITAFSDGGLRSYTPSSAYKLPETIRITPELNDKPLRPVRTDFKTRTTPNLPVILKVVSEPSLKANPQFANSKSDNFEGTISVFNKHPAGSLNPITFSSVTASFRLVGDETYNPVESLKILDSELPVTIEPRQSWSLKFQVVVPRSKEDAELGIRWWNRAFVCRHRPLRLKLVLQDIEEEEASLILEHMFNPFPLDKPRDSDIGFFYIDNVNVCDRYYLGVSESSPGVVQIGRNQGYEAKQLEKLVYQAVETGETEIDLKIGQEKEGGAWEWKAWALVDLSCRRVYAFKVLVQQGRLVKTKTAACMGYVLCPTYGTPADEVRPIRYASEVVKMPALEPIAAGVVVTDDALDDEVRPELRPNVQVVADGAGAGGVAISVTQEDLGRRLASVDANLARIATALEQLVGVLTKKY